MAPPRQTSFTEYTSRGINLRCEICKSQDNRFLRSCEDCDSEGLCLDCFKTRTCCVVKKEIIKEEMARERRQKTAKNESSSSVFSFSTIIKVAILIFSIAFIVPKFLNSNSQNLPSKEEIERQVIRELKDKFPNQKKEVWANIRHVVSGCLPVTTLTFLYKDDPATADCLAQQLAYSYAQIQNRNFSQESIFKAREISDFGMILEEYGLKIERTNLLVVNRLHEISGNVAKIFHTLCDSTAPRVNPSIFIFTLRENDRATHLTLIERANAVLRDAWKDLPEKYLPSLLSRVVTNVVEVENERKNICWDLGVEV